MRAITPRLLDLSVICAQRLRVHREENRFRFAPVGFLGPGLRN
jgi:hypothetical protein